MKTKTPKVWQNINNRTPDFLINNIYERQLCSSSERGHSRPDYDLAWLNSWVKSQPEFQSLFDAWIASECQTLLIPSVDRFNDAIGYTKDNLHKVMTWADNKRRGEVLRGQGVSKHKRYKEVHQFDIQGNYITTFHSAWSAYRALKGVDSKGTHIIQVCEGKRNIAEGFIWSFDRKGSDVALKIKNVNNTLKARAICGIHVKDNSYVELPSAKSAISEIKVQGANILKCLNGERHTAGEFSWKYLDNHLLDLLNEIEGINTKPKEKIHHSQINFDEDTCLVSINHIQ